MLLQSILIGALVAIGNLPLATAKAGDVLDKLTQKALANLKANGTMGAGCDLSTASVRKDWEDLTSAERLDYINAVKCLQAKPNITPLEVVPGARSRFDDFAATHINQTLTVHLTANFLGWHRYLLHTYETALREECGYTGYLAYWNWPAYSKNQTLSPVFDGSETSMSGDGAYAKHNGSLAGAGAIWLPSGNGGGCVTGGPFKDMVANIGPSSPAMDGLAKDVNGSFAYNPRCLRRDISNYASSHWLTYDNVLNVTLHSPTIAQFQNELQGRFSDGFLGLHASGHFTIGGEADDLFSSPVDPAFYLHHAMVDRTWWLWQAMHPRSGVYDCRHDHVEQQAAQSEWDVAGCYGYWV